MGKKQQSAKGKAVKGHKGPPSRGGKDNDDGCTDQRQQRKEKKQQRRRGEAHRYGGDDLERELAPLGLRVKAMEADGNCFFRSVCDQLEGEGGDHLALRHRVVDFIRDRAEEYRFFIEDDEPFDSYVRRMGGDGAWAGHLELHAASVLLQHNVSVYQAGQPVWHIRNFQEDAPTLHLSYHEGMHYNSVRNADDYGSGPPAPLRVRSGAELAAADPAALAAGQRSFGEREVERGVAGTGCADRDRAARVLAECRGDVDQAIELLIEQLGEEGDEEEQQRGEPPPPSAAPPADGAARREEPGAARAQQVAGSVGEQQGGAAATAERRSGQHAAGPAADGEQQQLQPGGPQGWCRVRLQLALDPEDPVGRARVALLPVWPQRAQQDKQEEDTQHTQHAHGVAAGPASTHGQDAGAAAGGGQAGAAEGHGGKERPGRKGARLKAKAVSHPGRNKPCPCGSKVKFKDCCARKDRRKAGGSEGDASNLNGAAVAAAQLQVLLI